MTNSRKIEILRLLIQELQNPEVKSTNKTGMCLALRGLHSRKSITAQEYLHIDKFLHSQKPNNTQYIGFTLLSSWNGGRYWWTAIYMDIKALEVRVEFLYTVIGNLESLRDGE